MTRGKRLTQIIPEKVYNLLIESSEKRGLTPSQLLILLITSYAPPVSHQPPMSQESTAQFLMDDLVFEDEA